MPVLLSVEEVVILVYCYPSCEEVIVVGLALCLVPLSKEVIVVWLSVISLLCEVIVVVLYLLCRGCVVGEMSCVRLVYICQIPSGDSLCGKSCADV